MGTWWTTDDGAVFIHGATAVLHCSLEEELPAGDHQIALLRIEALEANPDITPLVFHQSRFTRLDSPT